MIHVARAIVEVFFDLVRLAALFLRPASTIRAENLALRKQLAAYIERGIKPRRLDHADRVSLSVLARLFSWREAIVIVHPATVIRWHRLGLAHFLALEEQGGSATDSAGSPLAAGYFAHSKGPFILQVMPHGVAVGIHKQW